MGVAEGMHVGTLLANLSPLMSLLVAYLLTGRCLSIKYEKGVAIRAPMRGHGDRGPGRDGGRGGRGCGS
jgi:hypothetical protein